MDDEPRVRCGDRSIPLNEIKQRASRLATALREEHGVGHGERYAIVLRNEPAFLEATLAAGLIGAVPVPVNWHWTGDDLRHLLHDSGAKVAIVHSDLLPAVERHAPDGLAVVEAEVPAEVAAAYGSRTSTTGRHPLMSDLIDGHDPVSQPNTEPPMGVIYTSGTTGLAKGILRNPIPPSDLPQLAQLVGQLLKLKPGWRTMEPAPMYHTAPNVHATFAAAFGMDTRIMPKFDAEEFLRLVQDEQVDTVQLVPTMFTRLLALPEDVRRRYDTSSLKAVVHAAAPCPVEVKRAMIDWLGPIVWEYYGGSEGGGWTMHDSQEALDHPGTVGRPFLDGDIRILGPDGQEVPAGETGMVYGRSPAVWPQFTYLNNEEGRRAIEVDGYITIGDIGHVDEDGYLYLSDRAHDMVVAGGVNIYPAEIENVLHGLDTVADVAVFGIPDPDLGEAVAAHVQPAAGAALTADDVRRHVGQHLAAYKVPKVVEIVDDLPREETGKLFKRRLQQAYR